MKRLFALALLAGVLASVAPASSKGPLRVTVTNDVSWHGSADVIVSQTGMGITMTVAPHRTSSISVPLLATTLRLKTRLCDTKLALPLEYLAERTHVWVTIQEGCILRLQS